MAETTYGTAPEDSHVMSERVQALASSIYQEFERMMKRYDEDVVKELMPLVVGILENLDQAHQEKQENDVELELLRDDNEQLLTQYEREKQLRKASEQKCLEVEDVLDEERKELQGKVESLESVVRMMELKGKNAQDHIMRLEDKESDMKKEYNKLHERYTDLFKTHMDYMERTKLVMGSDKIVEMSASPRTRGGFHMPQLKPVNPGLYQSGETPVTPEGGYPGDMNDITSPTKSNDSNVSLKHELKDIETAEKEQNTEVYVTTKGTATKNSNVGNVESGPSEGDKDSPTKSTNSTVENVTNSEIESTLEPYLTGQTNLEHEELGCDTTESERRQGKEGESNQPSDGKATKRDLPELQISEIAGDVSFEDDQFGDMMQSPESEDGNFLPNKSTPLDASKRKPADGSSIFDELGMQEVAAVDDGVDITAKCSHCCCTKLSDTFYGMGKEVENLILENTELLATKNALNIVKDDLIVKVDELTSEQEILKEEISSLQTVREKLKQRVTELEADLKKSREDLEKIKEKQASGQEGEETVEGEVPMAQRKRFTRVEMARVLMERNQYKERLMELQEAVRWTEMIRASKEHPDVVPASKKKGSIWNLFSGLGFSSNSNTSNSRGAAASGSLTASHARGKPSQKQRTSII